MTVAYFKVHALRLLDVARHNDGKLPSHAWLFAHGYGKSLRIVCEAGILWRIERHFQSRKARSPIGSPTKGRF
jgi:hypothetical protein